MEAVMSIFCIFRDTHPLGDYVVREMKMEGEHTAERVVGRAESVEAARAMVPEGKQREEIQRGPTALVEVWL
jgi:hypothetical protein